MEESPPSAQEICRVVSYIRYCIKNWKSKEESIDLGTSYNIRAALTRAVWEKMEKQNEKFFRTYYMSLALLIRIRQHMSCSIEYKILVHRFIYLCIQIGMTKNEINEYLATHCNIEEHLIRQGWREMQQETGLYSLGNESSSTYHLQNTQNVVSHQTINDTAGLMSLHSIRKGIAGTSSPAASDSNHAANATSLDDMLLYPWELNKTGRANSNSNGGALEGKLALVDDDHLEYLWKMNMTLNTLRTDSD